MRVSAPARGDMPAKVALLVDLATPQGGEPPPTISVLAHQPALLEPFLTWAAALALEGKLPRRDHEILALRTARNFGSSFEWHEHVRFARSVGLNNDEIEHIRIEAGEHAWTAHEMALIQVADDLHTDHVIGDETWNALAAHYSDAELVEIPYIVGQYALLSMVANAIGA